MTILKDQDIKVLREKVKSPSKTLLYAALLATCGFPYGLGLGTFNTFVHFFIINYIRLPQEIARSTEREMQVKKLINFAYFIGCTSSCAFGHLIYKNFGVYRSALINIAVYSCSTALLIIHNEYLLYAVRFFQGLTGYLWVILAPRMMRENLPPPIYEKLGYVFNFVVTTGVFIGYCFGNNVCGYHWRAVLLFPLLSEVPRFVAFLFFPMESPTWLVGREVTVSTLKQNYSIFYTEKIADKLARHLQSEREHKRQQNQRTHETEFSELFKPKYRLQFLLCAVMSMLHQLTGMNIFAVYSDDILKQVGIRKPSAITQGMGIVGLISVVTVMLVNNKIGKRSLLIFGFLGQIIGYSIFFFGIGLGSPVLLVVGMYSAMFMYNISLGGVLSFYNADLLPAVGLFSVAMIKWGIASLLIYFTHKLGRLLTVPGMFLFAQLFAVFGGIFYIGYSIETVGKTDKAIEREFMSKRFFDVKLY